MIPEEIKNYLPQWIILVFAAVGLLVVILKSLQYLFDYLPSLKRRTYDRLAQWTKNKKLIKAAQAANIEESVNGTIVEFQKEFPPGWVRKVEIQWVSKVKPTEIKEGELILKIQPAKFQEENFVSAIYVFFRQVLFPTLKETIPRNIQEATSLEITHRAIRDKHPYLSKVFEGSLLEPSINKDPSLVNYLEKYELIDKKGFFTGIFIRELNEIASRARFKSLRNKLDEETISLLDHLREFVRCYESKSEEDIISDDYWYRKGPETSYAIILVAEPSKSRREGIRPYLKRVEKWLDQGIERLYVMGAEKQKGFVQKVVGSIDRIPNLELGEIFNPNRDYRGKRGGLCALFIALKKK